MHPIADGRESKDNAASESATGSLTNLARRSRIFGDAPTTSKASKSGVVQRIARKVTICYRVRILMARESNWLIDEVRSGSKREELRLSTTGLLTGREPTR